MLSILRIFFLTCFIFFLQKGFTKKLPPSPQKKKIQNFPKIYNPEVQRWISFFSKNPNSYLKPWLKKSYRYFPMMEKIFLSKNLPKELVAMSAIESSFSAHAVSRANAVGYWQFIQSTGLQFGLRITPWIDERRDFEKSTKAAASYLYKLYIDFENWLLAMSAYNMGEKRLNSLIKKYKDNNFWTLRKKPDFPKETALYIPKILAVVHLLKYPADYGFKEFVILTPYQYDIFFIPGGTHLKEISTNTKIAFADLKKLNPDLKTHLIPKYISEHPIRIPKGKGLLISHWLDKKEKK
ncbi:MAG: lytic transglycosylase domain-containing protein [Bdellovibrionales bacterium]|nr:lytic transglycosylase domain-containing protein [Bdellovibrionales bacterium]